MDKTYHEEVLKFFGQDVEKYYFIISDLLKNDYCGDNFKLYGEYENNKLKSIMLNNFNNLTYYCKEDRSIHVYENIIKDLNFEKISGPSHLVDKLIPFVDVKSDTLSYMGYVSKLILKRQYNELPLEFIETEEEFSLQYDLLMSTEEYHGVLPIKKNYILQQASNINSQSRTAYLLVDDKMVSSAATVAEHDRSAIVVGVVTNPSYREKGYGSEVLIGLFESLLKEGKKPYLFYNNPVAGRVYKKIGMEEVCQWRVIFVK